MLNIWILIVDVLMVGTFINVKFQNRPIMVETEKCVFFAGFKPLSPQSLKVGTVVVCLWFSFLATSGYLTKFVSRVVGGNEIRLVAQMVWTIEAILDLVDLIPEAAVKKNKPSKWVRPLALQVADPDAAFALEERRMAGAVPDDPTAWVNAVRGDAPEKLPVAPDKEFFGFVDKGTELLGFMSVGERMQVESFLLRNGGWRLKKVSWLELRLFGFRWSRGRIQVKFSSLCP